MRPLVSSGRLLIALLISPVLASAANPRATEKGLLPIDDFAQLAVVGGMRMSPDGKAIAYTAAADQKYAIIIKELDTGKVQGVDDGYSPQWVNSGRIVFGASAVRAEGLVAIDRNGNNYTPLLGRARQNVRHETQTIIWGGVIFRDFPDPAKTDHVLLQQFDYPDYVGRYAIQLSFPHVMDMDTRSGNFQRSVENPGGVIRWLPDAQGRVLVGTDFSKGKTRVIHRKDEKSPWRVPAGLDWATRALEIQGLSADAKTLYLSRITANGKSALYSYDLVKEQMGEVILAHDHYDILPIDGSGGGELILAPRTREVLGVSYNTDLPRVAWFDQEMAAIQASLDKALPERINTIADMNNDRNRFLVRSWSARDPGTYYVFDLVKQNLTPVMPAMPWIKPERMAEMMPISYTSRDGLTIRGYLTVPVGHAAKNLPLVVLPHGGPFARDGYSYNPDVQFLANRGYAVLQVNYRGSTGFGRDFLEKGMRHVGREMIDDITDGAKWAVKKHVADPDRIAIMGWSYGGYAALMGVIREPKLFRCAIDLAGVTDWKSLLKYDAEVSPHSVEATRDFIGDYKADAADLDDISPVNHVDAIQVPLLLVYSKSDDTVHYDQATAITKALDKAGKPYEFMSKFNEGHGFHEKKHRVALYQTIEAFLAKNMGPAAGP